MAAVESSTHAAAPGPPRVTASAPDSLQRFVRPRHRNDIQGLRAVAVLLVALSHGGVGFLKGGYVGVDVFFVLSGFLITQLLLSEAVQRGSVSLAEFYVRRARRILPAAALTLVATDVAAYYLLNFVRAKQGLTDSLWASVFASNIRFADQATNYFAQGAPPSPVLHFWSLSLEEQFYFVWPALLALTMFGTFVGLKLRRRSLAVSERSLRRLLVVAALAGIASFVWCVHATAVTPQAAYFSSLGRAWELSLGATLAIGASSLVRAAPARVAAGWIGVACIVVAAVAFSSTTAFPGYAALLPTLGAALVIVAGVQAGQPRFAVGRLLALHPMRYVGDRSYAFYLWHWPVLILTAGYVGHDLSLFTKLSLLIGAFALSCVTYSLYENPLRRMKWSRPAGLLLWPASATSVVIVALLSGSKIDGQVAHLSVARAAAQPAILVDSHISDASAPALPAVIASVAAAKKVAPIPSPLVPPIGKLEGDFYDYPDSGCVAHDGQTRSQSICRLTGSSSAPTTTTPSTTEPASTTNTKTLVVMGDSHSQMWMPAILSMAQRDGWTVIPLAKSRCTAARLFQSRGPDNEASVRAECRTWYRWALTEAKTLHPDAILLGVGYSSESVGLPAQQDVNGITAWESAVAFSKRVLVMADTPYLTQLPQPVDCLLARRATMKTCTGTWTATQLSVTRALTALAPLRGAHLIDTTGWFCFKYQCPLVVGHTIAYRDYGHVSATYARALAPTFRAAFRRAN